MQSMSDEILGRQHVVFAELPMQRALGKLVL